MRRFFRSLTWLPVAILLVGVAVSLRSSATPMAAMTIDGLVLEQNYPNPFSASTEIQYVLPSSGHALLRVFNMLGQEVGRPVDEDRPSGRSVAKFDGSSLPSGQYTYTLVFTADADKSIGKLTKKMYLLR